MSKLVQAIRSTNLEVHKADCMPLATITRNMDEQVVRGYNYLTKYKVQVAVGCEVYLRHTSELPLAIESSTRAIIEEVFGEFRRYHRELECALWDRNFDLAKNILKDMENQMFGY